MNWPFWQLSSPEEGETKYLYELGTVVEVIPKQVVEEVRRNLSVVDKQEAARKARGKIAELIEDGGREIDVTAQAIPHLESTLLGADSETDRQILRYAARLASEEHHATIVASCDGGIFYDIVKLSKAGIRIFYFSHTPKLRLAKLAAFIGDYVGCRPPPYLSR